MNTSKTRAILVSSIGGGLELYDFTIYVFFAPILGKLFFPPENNFIALLDTFAVFAVGYFSRPIGAILFGHYGDKHGRKKGMLISIAIMALTTVGIGLLPSYATIGIFAPILLVFFRFLQGLAVGGDLPGAITFVAEYADNQQRGLYCSFVYCAVNIGLTLASAIGALLTTLLSSNQLMTWGWRVAFLLGMGIAIVGFYLRTKIEETPYFQQLEKTRAITAQPLLYLFRNAYQQILQSIGLVWLFAVIIAQLFLYMPTYLNTMTHLPLNTALIFNSCNILLFSLFIPLIGLLSDRIGRRPVIITTAIAFIILTYPLYHLLNTVNLTQQLIALGSFAFLAAGIVGTVPCVLAEMFATPVRYSGVAIAYNIGFAIFAGLTPVFVTYLLYVFQSPLAISMNLIVGAIVTLTVALRMKEGSQQTLLDSPFLVKTGA